MSAATVDRFTVPLGGGPVASADDGSRGIPFARLLHVELRKMVDTRAGRWLLIAIAGLGILMEGASIIWGDAPSRSFPSLLATTLTPIGMLLPVLGALAATQEWSQRTGLSTFTLEPRRGRVVTAKLVAGCLLALLLTSVGFLSAAIGHAIAQVFTANAGTWSLTLGAAAGPVLALLIAMVQGMAFGFLLRNTPLAVVSLLLLPTLWSIGTIFVEVLKPLSAWLDLNVAQAPLSSGSMHPIDWAHLATAGTLWVLLPLAIGTWRIRRIDIA